MTTENIVDSFEQWSEIVTPIWNVEGNYPNYLLDAYAAFYLSKVCDGFMTNSVAKKNDIEYEAKTEQASSINDLISFKKHLLEVGKKILLYYVIYRPSLPSYCTQEGDVLTLREVPIMTPENWLIRYAVIR
jgi:hypothetical protein